MMSAATLSSSAMSAEITFQELSIPSGTPVVGQYAFDGVKFDGFYFSDDPAIAIDGQGVFSFTGNISSPQPNPKSFVNFIKPVTNLSIDYGKIGNPPGGFVQLEGIDEFGQVFGLQSISGGPDVSTTFNVGPRVIKTLIFSAAESGDAYITGLRFDPIRSAVPEPSSWAFMVVGFGLLGGVLRKKRENRAGARLHSVGEILSFM